MGLFDWFGGGSNYTTSTTKTKLGTTTTQNPFVNSKTTNKGTESDFVEGNAFDTINNFVNSNIGNILNDYMNPNLNSTTNQALLNSYLKNLGTYASQTFENKVVNPLSNRNMIRSSQATDMYNNFNNALSDNISTYINSLLSDSQKNSAEILNNMLSAYLKGFNVLNANQAQSLRTSSANATKTTTGNGGVSSSTNYGDIIAQLGIELLPQLITLFM